MKTLIVSTALVTGLLSLAFYSVINYVLFRDFGFVPAGRVVFASYFGYLDYLILPLGLCIAILILKRTQNTSAFKDLFLFGLKTTVLASVLFSAFIFLSLTFADPDYFGNLIGLIKQMESSEATLAPLKKEMLVRIKPIEENALFQQP